MSQSNTPIYCKCCHCGAFFEINGKRSKYCSEKHRRAAAYKRKRPKKIDANEYLRNIFNDSFLMKLNSDFYAIITKKDRPPVDQ